MVPILFRTKSRYSFSEIIGTSVRFSVSVGIGVSHLLVLKNSVLPASSSLTELALLGGWRLWAFGVQLKFSQKAIRQRVRKLRKLAGSVRMFINHLLSGGVHRHNVGRPHLCDG